MFIEVREKKKKRQKSIGIIERGVTISVKDRYSPRSNTVL